MIISALCFQSDTLRAGGSYADMKIDPLTRREFVKATAAGAGALLLSESHRSSAQASPDRAREYGAPLTELGYGDVSFMACPQQAQLEQTHAILMSLDEDGLMRPFRRAAGLPAPGRDLGGWHSSPDTFGPESFGYWMLCSSQRTSHRPAGRS